jgi:hypothetical protein
MSTQTVYPKQNKKGNKLDKIIFYIELYEYLTYFENNLLSVVRFVKTYTDSMGCIFIQLIVSFAMKKTLV